MEKSAERIEFLSGILGEVTGAGTYGFFYLVSETGEGTRDHTARIIAKEDACDEYGIPMEDIPEDKIVTVDLDTIAKGLGVIQRSVLREVTEGYDKGNNLLHNVRTGQRLYLSVDRKNAIRGASFSNDASGSGSGDLDILDYLAILECALFGAVMYA